MNKILNLLIEVAGIIYLMYSIFTQKYILTIIILLSFILMRLDNINKKNK
jgi:hypothetical protein